MNETSKPNGDIAARFDRLEEMIEHNAEVAAAAVETAAAEVAESTEAKAEAVEKRLVAHDSALDKLQEVVGDVNTSVRNLLDSVIVLQRNSMRVLGAGALVCGVLIFVLSRAAGY